MNDLTTGFDGTKGEPLPRKPVVESFTGSITLREGKADADLLTVEHAEWLLEKALTDAGFSANVELTRSDK